MGVDLEFDGNLDGRVQRLEHECFLLRWLGFIAAGGTLYLALLAPRPMLQAEPARAVEAVNRGSVAGTVAVPPVAPEPDPRPKQSEPGEVKATRFVLLDQGGAAAATLGFEADGVGLTLFNSKRDRMTIRLLSDGRPAISMQSYEGTERPLLGPGPKEHQGLAVSGLDPHPGYPEALKRPYWIEKDGLTFMVNGWLMTDGAIRCFYDDPENVESKRLALARNAPMVRPARSFAPIRSSPGTAVAPLASTR